MEKLLYHYHLAKQEIDIAEVNRIWHLKCLEPAFLLSEYLVIPDQVASLPDTATSTAIKITKYGEDHPRIPWYVVATKHVLARLIRAVFGVDTTVWHGKMGQSLVTIAQDLLGKLTKARPSEAQSSDEWLTRFLERAVEGPSKGPDYAMLKYKLGLEIVSRLKVNEAAVTSIVDGLTSDFGGVTEEGSEDKLRESLLGIVHAAIELHSRTLRTISHSRFVDVQDISGLTDGGEVVLNKRFMRPERTLDGEDVEADQRVVFQIAPLWEKLGDPSALPETFERGGALPYYKAVVVTDLGGEWMGGRALIPGPRRDEEGAQYWWDKDTSDEGGGSDANEKATQ